MVGKVCSSPNLGEGGRIEFRGPEYELIKEHVSTELYLSSDNCPRCAQGGGPKILIWPPKIMTFNRHCINNIVC